MILLKSWFYSVICQDYVICYGLFDKRAYNKISKIKSYLAPKLKAGVRPRLDSGTKWPVSIIINNIGSSEVIVNRGKI